MQSPSEVDHLLISVSLHAFSYKQEDLHVYVRRPWQLKYEVDGTPKIVTYWLAEVNNICKEPKLSAEHTEYKWLNKDDIKCFVGFSDYKTMLGEMHHFIVTKILLKKVFLN